MSARKRVSYKKKYNFAPVNNDIGFN
jgi:hypothetical protein